MVDEMLEEISDPEAKSASNSLLGKTGISNAKIAYSLYKEIFYGERFLHLKREGRQAATCPLGQHQHEKSQLLRYLLCGCLDRTGNGQHYAANHS